MTIAVADATVLIYLAKLGELRLLDELFDECLVTEAVYAEVVERGRSAGYRDAIAVDEAVGELLTMRSLGEAADSRVSELRQSAALGRGEAEAIVLALQEDSRCLTDDHAARTTARSLGVEVGGTIYVLLAALERGHLQFEEYVARLDALTDRGFRMDATLYRKAVAAGREIGEE